MAGMTGRLVGGRGTSDDACSGGGNGGPDPFSLEIIAYTVPCEDNIVLDGLGRRAHSSSAFVLAIFLWFTTPTHAHMVCLVLCAALRFTTHSICTLLPRDREGCRAFRYRCG